jgi:putative membrane protein
MFFDSVKNLVRGLLPIVILLIVRPKSDFSYWAMLALPLVVGLVCLIAWLRYLNFTFYLDPEAEEFILQEGVLGKTKTVIALDKIQQVNITQNLVQRIIGVHALEIDTAGTQKQEAVIRAVSHPLALALKARLLEGERKPDVRPSGGAEIQETQPLMEIGLGSLFKVGITANYVRSFWILFVFVMTMYDHARQLVGAGSLNTAHIRHFVVRQSAVTLISVVVIGFLSIVIITNLLRIIITYYGYRIAKQQGSLLLSFGLINTKSTIVRPERVQTVSIVQNWLQKKMHVLGMKVRQAGGSETQSTHKQAGHMLEIPGCNASERDAILRLLYGAVPEKGLMVCPNWRKLGFSVFLMIGLPMAAFYTVAAYAPELYAHQYLPFIYAMLMLGWLWLGFRNYRLYLGDRFIIKKHGVWDIAHEIVEPAKIQAITTSQLFWHKSADIGYLTLHTAGGNLAFQLGNFTVIRAHVNRWLYEMESSDVNWM